MMYDMRCNQSTGATHGATHDSTRGPTQITSFFRHTRRETPGKARKDFTGTTRQRDPEREAMQKAGALHSSRNPSSVVSAAHIMSDNFKNRMVDSEFRYSNALNNLRTDMALIAHKNGPTPHLRRRNTFFVPPTASDDERTYLEYEAWQRVGDALAYFEATFYTDTDPTGPTGAADPDTGETDDDSECEYSLAGRPMRYSRRA